MILSANRLLKEKNYLRLNDLFYQTYAITDWISKDYPQHFSHFYTKYVPGVFSGTREILAYYEGVVLEGVCVLKRTSEEKKICTLFVKEEARGKHLATRLLSEAFIWLETTKPLITIADYKASMFKRIIEKYDWGLTQILPCSYYGNAQEYVYNGTIDPS